MKDYSNYTAIDFALDKDFQEWVLHPEENSSAHWEEVILLHPDKQEIIRKATGILRSLKFTPIPASGIPEEKILQSITDKIRQDREKALEQALPTSQVSRHHFPGWQKVAASIALTLCLSWMLYFFFFHENSQVVQTAYGETREVSLPDGSSVVLNANSSLQFSTDWNNVSEREVWLNGEAYFRVAKITAANISSDQEQPPTPVYQKFVVHTQDLDVVVRGTAFNVNQRQEKTQVVLTEGKVEVKINNEQKVVALAPGELLEYAPLQRSIAKAIVNPKVYTSWQTHQLIFDGVPLTQVAQRLEEIFGYEVVCREEVRDHIFKGTVPSDDMEVSLEVIQNAFGIKVTKNKRQIIFSK